MGHGKERPVVKIVREERLISCGEFPQSWVWKNTRAKLLTAIKAVAWPPGSGRFTIYPEGGKERGKGNGVKPIKTGLMNDLKEQGWSIEGSPVPAGRVAGRSNFGNYDAIKQTKYGPVVVEWETGNISSSHRSLNKMALGVKNGLLAGGVLIVPSREMYVYLTDRVGNMQELEPYLDLWKAVPCVHGGVLEIIEIEHDATSKDVPRIPKGTDGRALG